MDALDVVKEFIACMRVVYGNQDNYFLREDEVDSVLLSTYKHALQVLATSE